MADHHEFTVSKSPWGQNDEMGRLNLLTDESRAKIMSRVDGSRLFDLSSEYFVGMPTWSALGDPSYQLYKTHDPAGDLIDNPAGLSGEANALTSYTGDAIHMYTHSGTHLDALNHFGCHGEIFNGFRHEDHVGSRAWDKCGVDVIPPVIARGILLDVAAYKGLDQLPAGYGIGAADLAATADIQGVEIAEGDVVLIRTGRFQEWPNPEKFLTDEPDATSRVRSGWSNRARCWWVRTTSPSNSFLPRTIRRGARSTSTCSTRPVARSSKSSTAKSSPKRKVVS